MKKLSVGFFIGITIAFAIGFAGGIMAGQFMNTGALFKYKDMAKSNIKQTVKKLTGEEEEALKAKVEQDVAEYGNNYRECTYIKNKNPDRIYFKSANQPGFFMFEKTEECFAHLEDVCEDRMSYSVIDDFNLNCFSPDSIDTMLVSEKNYVVFDYDSENLNETDMYYQKPIIFSFSEGTRLYRLLTYLSNSKEIISRENLGKDEFASNTKTTGYKYMNDDYYGG